MTHDNRRPIDHARLKELTLNVVGGGEPWSYPLIPVVGETAKLALAGTFDKEWLEAVFEGQAEARTKAVNWARMVLLFNAALVAVSIVLKLWPLPFLVTLAPFIANWLRYFIGAPMHTGLKDDVADFRRNVSLRLTRKRFENRCAPKLSTYRATAAMFSCNLVRASRENLFSSPARGSYLL